MEIKTRKFIRIDFEELQRKLQLGHAIKWLYSDSIQRWIEVELEDGDEQEAH